MARPQQLVSQWQSRLATAERLAAGSLRLRWLHLAQARLYRFLLSCYGSGQWRTGLSDDQPRPLIVDELTEFSSATGKPPKGAGKIQAVLKSVQNAQDHPPEVGPWTEGIDPNTYMAVTDNESKIDVERCREFLEAQGLRVRIIGRGRQRVVAVPYCQLDAAAALVDRYRNRLRPFRTRSIVAFPSRPVFTLEARLFAAIVGILFVASIGVIFTAMALPAGELGFGAIIGLLIAAVVAVAEASLIATFLFIRKSRPALSIDARTAVAKAARFTIIAVPVALGIVALLAYDSALGQFAIYMAILAAIILFGDRAIRR